MNVSLWRSIRGPVILITIGTLFAVDNFLNIGFDRTWPVLIIIIGIMKLLEHGNAPAPAPYQSHQQPYQAPYQSQPPYSQTPPPPPPPPPAAPMPPDYTAGGPRQ